MSPQDDAANCAWSDYRKDYGVSNHEPIRTREYKAFHAGWEAAKAGLERDYYLVKLADLPEVTEEADIFRVEGVTYTGSWPASDYLTAAHRFIAIFIHKADRESDAAVLARRRDELTQQYGFVEYDGLMQWAKDLIDRTLAAEAEVAQLKEGRS